MAAVRNGLRNFCLDKKHFAFKNWSGAPLFWNKRCKTSGGYLNVNSLISNFGGQFNKSRIFCIYSAKDIRKCITRQENLTKLFTSKIYSTNSKELLKLTKSCVRGPLMKYVFKKHFYSNAQRQNYNYKLYQLMNNIKKQLSADVQKKQNAMIDYYSKKTRSFTKRTVRSSPLLTRYSDPTHKKRLLNRAKFPLLPLHCRNNGTNKSTGMRQITSPAVIQTIKNELRLLKRVNRSNTLSCSAVNLGNINHCCLRNVHYRSTFRNPIKINSNYCKTKGINFRSTARTSKSVNTGSELSDYQINSNAIKFGHHYNEAVKIQKSNTYIAPKYRKDEYWYKLKNVIPYKSLYENITDDSNVTNDELKSNSVSSIANDQLDKIHKLKPNFIRSSSENDCHKIEALSCTDLHKHGSQPNIENNNEKDDTAKNKMVLPYNTSHKNNIGRLIYSSSKKVRKHSFSTNDLVEIPKFRHKLRTTAVKGTYRIHGSNQKVTDVDISIAVNDKKPSGNFLPSSLPSRSAEVRDTSELSVYEMPRHAPMSATKYKLDSVLSNIFCVNFNEYKNNLLSAIMHMKLLNIVNKQQESNKCDEKSTPMTSSNIKDEGLESAKNCTVDQKKANSSRQLCSSTNNSTVVIPEAANDNLKCLEMSNNVLCNVKNPVGRLCRINVNGEKVQTNFPIEVEAEIQIKESLPLQKHAMDKSNCSEHEKRNNKPNENYDETTAPTQNANENKECDSANSTNVNHSHNRKHKNGDKNTSDEDDEDNTLNNVVVSQCNSHSKREELHSQSSDCRQESVKRTPKLQTIYNNQNFSEKNCIENLNTTDAPKSAIDSIKQPGNNNYVEDISILNGALNRDKISKLKANKICSEKSVEASSEGVNTTNLASKYKVKPDEVCDLKKYSSSRLKTLMYFKKQEHNNAMKMFLLGKNKVNLKSSNEKLVKHSKGPANSTRKRGYLSSLSDNLKNHRKVKFAQFSTGEQRPRIRSYTSYFNSKLNIHNCTNSNPSKQCNQNQETQNKNKYCSDFNNKNEAYSPYHFNDKTHINNYKKEATLNKNAHLPRMLSYIRHAMVRHEYKNRSVNTISDNNMPQLVEKVKQNKNHFRNSSGNKIKLTQSMTEMKAILKWSEELKHRAATYRNRIYQEICHHQNGPFLLNVSAPTANNFLTDHKLSDNAKAKLKNNNLNNDKNRASRNGLPEGTCRMHKPYKKTNTNTVVDVVTRKMTEPQGRPFIKLIRLNSSIDKLSQNTTRNLHGHRGSTKKTRYFAESDKTSVGSNNITLGVTKPNAAEYININRLNKTNRDIERVNHGVPENCGIDTYFTAASTVNKPIAGFLNTGTRAKDNSLWLEQNNSRYQDNAKEITNKSGLFSSVKNKLQSNKFPLKFPEKYLHLDNLGLDSKGMASQKDNNSPQAGKKTDGNTLEENIKQYQKRHTNYILQFNSKINPARNDYEKLNLHRF